jgi:hypothetical protein
MVAFMTPSLLPSHTVGFGGSYDFGGSRDNDAERPGSRQSVLFPIQREFVAALLRILPDFSQICRAKLLICFVFMCFKRTLDLFDRPVFFVDPKSSVCVSSRSICSPAFIRQQRR